MKPIRIIAKDPGIDIEIPMGDGPAIPTGGFGSWIAIPRQDDVAVTDWEGQEPLTEAVPLLLDGYAKGDSVQREWNTVKKLGRDPNGDERRPPVFKVYGPIDAPEGKSWVLPDGGITPNTASIIKSNDGDLLRIEFTLSLLEYVRPDTIRRRTKARRGIGKGQALTYTTRAGDTLESIAARVLGDRKLWKALGKKNGLHDPLRSLPANRTLNLP
jgi:LysM repeat protein